MARVNLDGKVWKDPRVKRLARRRAWSLRETIGTLAAVWDVAIDNRSPLMPRIDVDTAAESDDFADDMIAEELATPVGDDLINVRLRGVEERIQFLILQAEKGRKGGQAKAARGRADGAFVAGAKPGLSTSQATAKPPGSLDLGTDRDQDQDQDHRAAAGAARAASADAIRLASLLAERIASSSPGTTIAKLTPEARARKAATWAGDIDKLIRIDGIAVADVELAIEFATADPFWAPNIQSGKKLREKYDTLTTQRARTSGTAGRGRGPMAIPCRIGKTQLELQAERIRMLEAEERRAAEQPGAIDEAGAPVDWAGVVG